MRKIFSILAAFAALASSISCIREDIMDTPSADVTVALDLCKAEAATKAVQTGFRKGNVIFVFFNDDLNTGNCIQNIKDGKYLRMSYDGTSWRTQVNQDYLNQLPAKGFMNALYISDEESCTLDNVWWGPTFNLKRATLSNGREGRSSYDLLTGLKCSYDIVGNRLTGKITLKREHVDDNGNVNLQFSVSGMPEGEWYLRCEAMTSKTIGLTSMVQGVPCKAHVFNEGNGLYVKMSALDGDMVAYGGKNYSLDYFSTLTVELFDNATGKSYTRIIPTGAGSDDKSLYSIWNRSEDEDHYYYASSAFRMPFSAFEESYEKLDGADKANCYVIDKAGRYSFDATTRGNGIEVNEAGVSSVNVQIAGARLLWQTAKGMVSGLKCENGRICFTASEACGSAVIAATDSEDNVIWSWHIWHPETPVSGIATEGGCTLMNMNLGALDDGSAGITPDCYGMLYQWGRKDPFPGSPALTGNTATMPRPTYDIDGNAVSITHTSWSSTTDNSIGYAIAHPEAVISNYAQYGSSRDWIMDGHSKDRLWGSPREGEEAEKTMFDPCPPGWMMPGSEALAHATSTGGYTNDYGGFSVVDTDSDGEIGAGDFTYGWTLHMDRKAGTSSFFPAAGRYDGQYAMLYGSVAGLWGAYWSRDPYASDKKGLASAILTFSNKEMSAKSGGSRADAYSVRCCRKNDI